MVINQSSNNLITNWDSFNIGEAASVEFVQPDASSAALNRVLDNNPSQILGSLSSNGQVFLVNPAGVFFGENAQVDVGGLVASTLDINDQDFLDGKLAFENGTATQGTIENLGKIAAKNGMVAMIGAQVVNRGQIMADGGQVSMASGDKVTLDFNGDGLMTVTVEQAVIDGLVENKGLIQANDGGSVVMTADAASEIFKSVVNNDGIIVATGLESKGGRIVLTGSDVGLGENSIIDASGELGGGQVLVGGGFQGNDVSVANASTTTVAEGAQISANAGQSGDGGEVIVWADDHTQYQGHISATGGEQSGNGGFVEVSGKQTLDFQGTVDLTASQGEVGTLLLDPTDLTISAGLDTNVTIPPATEFEPVVGGGSTLNATTLTNALKSANVIVTTNNLIVTGAEIGLITVATDLTYDSPYKLTLATASTGGVVVNTGTNITNSGFGGFQIDAGTAGIDLDNSALTFAGGPVTLNSEGDIAGTGSITTTTADDTGISSGKVTFVAAGSIDYEGLITTTGAINNAGQGSAAGEVVMTVGDAGSAAVHTITTGNINTIGGAGTDGIGGGGGSITLRALGTGTTNNITTGTYNANGGASSIGVFDDAYNGGNAGNLLVDAGDSNIILNGNISLQGGISSPQGLGGNARFKSDVLLRQGISINTGSTNGNVTFEETTNSEISNDEQDLTIVAGEGSVVFNGEIGTGSAEAQELSTLDVAAMTITAKQNITARDGVDFDAVSGIVLGDTATLGQTLTINTNRDDTSAVGNGSVLMDAGNSTTRLYADLVVTRGTGEVDLRTSSGSAVTGTAFAGDGDNYDITINGSGAADASTGDVTIYSSNSYSLFDIGDIALSQVGDLSIRGHIKANSLVYGDEGTGNVDLALSNTSGSVFSGSATKSYDLGTGSGAEAHNAGMFIETAGSIAVGIDHSLTSNGAKIFLIANGVSDFSGTDRSLFFSSQLYSDLTTANGLIYLKGEGVYQVDGVNIADITAGNQRIIVDGGDEDIYLGGRLTTTHGDTDGPAVLLRNATNVSITGVSNSKNGTLQIGTAKSGGSSADVTGDVNQLFDSGNGINVKTISAYTGGDISITSDQNNFDHTGIIELGGKLNVQSDFGGLSLLGDITATQVRLATGDAALGLGDFNVTTVTGAGDGDGTVILIGRGVTQGAGSVVDAGASTLAVDGKDVDDNNSGNIDLAGELKTTNNTASAVRVYHSVETNSTIKVGQITATSGQVTIGTSSTTLSGGSTSGIVSQYTDDIDSTNIIDADDLLVRSRGTVTLNNDNRLNELLGVRYGGNVDIKDMDGLLLSGDIQTFSGNSFFNVKLESAATGGTGAALLDINGQNITANGITLLGQGTGANVTLTGGVVSDGGTLEAKNGAILVDAGDGEINFSGTNISTDNIANNAVSMLNTGVGGDVVLGDITAENSAGNVGGLILGSTTDAKQIGGDVSQEANSVLRVGRITGEVTGNVDLTENNIVRYNNTTAGTLADFNAGGSFSFKNIDASNLNRGLSITGAITAGGAVDIESDGGALNLTGSIDGAGVSLESNLAAGEIILAGNVDANAGDVSLIANGRNASTLKSITQNAGIITSAGTLSGSSQSQVDLVQANNIAELGPFAASALSFELNNLGRGNNALTLVGDISAATDITLTTSGLLDLSTFNVSSSTGLIKLTGVGVSQSAGSAVSSTSGNSGAVSDEDKGGVRIDGGAAAVTLAGSLSTGNSGLAAGNINAILVQNASTVQLGDVSAASGRFTLGLDENGKRITGQTTQANGTSVSARELEIFSSSSVSLANTTNTITTLNSSNTDGGMSLRDSAGGLLLAGDILEAGNGDVNVRTESGPLSVGVHDVTATGTGSIALTGEGINTAKTGVATSVIDAGSGTITLDGDSAGVTLAGDVTTTHNTNGSVTIKDATSVSLSNVTTGVNGSLTLGVSAGSEGVGAVTQVSGTKVVTGKVEGFAERASARASVDLSNLNNEFTQLGNLTTAALELYSKNTNGLTWVGDVDAAGTTEITSLGAIDLDTYNLLATGSTLNITGEGVAQSTATRGGAANPSTIEAASTNIQAGAESISLLSENNDFTGTVQLSSTGADAAIRDRNALTTSSIIRSGNIGLAGDTGITAIAGTTLSVAQEAITKTGAGIVDLRALGGNFQTSDTIQTDTGNISITQASGDDAHGITVNHTLTSNSGDISLSGDYIVHSNVGDLTTGVTGGIAVSANKVSTGSVTMVGGTVYTAGSGGIDLNAQNNISLAELTTTGDASLASTSGSIRDGLNTADINITGDLITLSALTGVGQSATNNQEVNLSGNTLVLSTDTVGIFVTNDKDVIIGDASAGAGQGEVNILTSGNLSIKADGSISTDKSITAAGNGSVHLETLGADQDISFGSDIAMVGGSLSLTTADGDISQTAGAITTAGITVDAGGDVTLAQANNDFTDDVDIKATGNVSLTDVNGIDLGRIDLTTGSLTVNAVGINQSDEITQEASAGDVSFNTGASAITLNNVNNEFTGAVSLNNSGANAVSIRDKNAIDLGSSSLGSGSLTVYAVGITQSGEIVQAAGSSAIFNGGTAGIELTDVDNEFTTVSASSSAGGISISESDGFAVNTIDAGSANDLNLQSGGDISTFAGAGLITAGAFSAKTLNDAGASITLTNTNNDVTSVDLQARNAADSSNSTGNINYVDNTGFEVAGLATGGTAVLTASSPVTQTGAASVDRLALSGSGSFVLDNTSNDIAHLASDATGNINVVSSTATTIDTVNTQGVTTGNADFALTAASIHLTQGIDAGTGDVYLETTNSASGTITQDAGEGISSSGLAIKSVGDVTLADSTNNVSKFAADLATDKTLTYRDVDGISVANLTDIAVSGNSVSGLQVLGSASAVSLDLGGLLTQEITDALIQLDGDLTIDTTRNTNAASVSIKNTATGGTELDSSIIAGDFVLSSNGNVTQTEVAGANNDAFLQVGDELTITGGSLLAGDSLENLLGGGLVTGVRLDNEIRLEGLITLSMDNGKLVGEIGDGIGANKQEIAVADLASIKVVSLSGGKTIAYVGADSGAITLGAADNAISGKIKITTAGTYNNSGSSVETGITQNGTLDLNEASFEVQASALNTPNMGTGEGVINLSEANNVFDGAIAARALGMDISITDNSEMTLGNISGASVTLNAGSNAITQSDIIRASNLLISDAGLVTLTSENFINTVAASGVAGFNLTNAQTLTVGSVNGTNGISSSDDVVLTADDLTLSQDITASGSDLTIQNLTTGTAINIGTTSVATDDLDLDAAELARLTDGFSSITLGSSTAGKMTVAASVFNDNLELVNGVDGIELTGAVNAGTNDIVLTTAGSVSQSGAAAITAAGLGINDASFVNLNVTTNNVATLAAENISGAFTYVDSDALTIGSVNSAGITSSGVVDISNQTGDISVTENIQGSSVVLNAGNSSAAGTATGGNVIVDAGTTVSATTGNAIIYTGSIEDSTGLTALVGSGSGNFRYNGDEASTYTGGGAIGATGLFAVYREQPTLDVTPDAASSQYGETPDLTGLTASYEGYVNGDTNAQVSGIGLFTTVATNASDVGSYNIAYSSGLLSAIGYAFADKAASVNEYAVIPRVISLSGTREYDQTTAADAADFITFNNVMAGEALTLTGAGTVADKNVANNKAVTAGTLALGDGVNGLASNYTLVNGTHQLSITPKSVTVSGIDAQDKVYDANTLATLITSGAIFNGLIVNDDLSVSGTAVFDDQNVGADINVTANLVLGGGDVGNYTLQGAPNVILAEITPKSVILSATKIYDALADLTGKVTIDTGIVGESLTYTGATASDVDVATSNKFINAITLADGTGLASNYQLPDLSTSSVNNAVVINPYAVDFTGTRSYNGTTDVNAGDLVLTLVGAEELEISGSGAVGDKHVATGKAVTSLGDLALQDGQGVNAGVASNYTLVGGTQTMDVTTANLTISTSDVVKTYDANTNALGTAIVDSNSGTQLFGNDSLIGGTFTFDSKDVSRDTETNAVLSDKTVAVSGVTVIDGNGGNNYTVTYSDNTSSTINAATIIVSGLTALDKVYDGTTAAMISTDGAVATGVIAGDSITLESATGTFASKDVVWKNNMIDPNRSVANVAAQSVTADTVTLSGTDRSNYEMAPVTGLSAKINPAALFVTATADSRIFDGTTDATAQIRSLDAVLLNPNDEVNLSFTSAAYNDASAGLNKFILVAGVDFDQTDAGADAGNYALVRNIAETFSNIDPAPLNTDSLPLDPLKETEDKIVETLVEENVEPSSIMVTDNTFVEGFVDDVPVRVNALRLKGLTNANEQPIVLEESEASMTLTASTGTLTEEGVKGLKLPVFESADSTSFVLGDTVEVNASKVMMSVKPNAVAPQELPNLDDLETAKLLGETEINVTSSDGSVITLSVSVTEDNLMMIGVPESASTVDQKQIILMGLAALKDLGIPLKNIRGIVIKRN